MSVLFAAISPDTWRAPNKYLLNGCRSKHACIYHQIEGIRLICKTILYSILFPPCQRWPQSKLVYHHSPAFLYTLCGWNTIYVCIPKNTLFSFAYFWLSINASYYMHCSVICVFFTLHYAWSSSMLCVALIHFHHCIVFYYMIIPQWIDPFVYWHLNCI